ncbi:melanoma-associated antigen B10-like [Cynocephalus volans]|uniref:melanoma-associated antigen B10-like n=1 Tax=Cynocephalus volans TaxID=110931 RepID=UPI002FCBF1EC
MPRGQKSKLRAREKRRQAREEPEVVKGAPATAAEEEKSVTSSSPRFKENPQRSSAAGTLSHHQEPQKAPSSTAAAAAASSTRPNEGTTSEAEERPNASQAQASTEHMGLDPLDKKVTNLVRYLLYKYQRKEPIRKVDMLRNVIKMDKNQFPEILRGASRDLELIFGLDVKEVGPNGSLYVLVNKLDLSCDGRVNDNTGLPKTGLLMTVLAVIFSKGNCATEQHIWEVLNMMGIYDGVEHFIYGEPRKFLTEDWVKEMYLEYRQVPNSDPPSYLFRWGPRAYAETSKMKVLKFLSKIHGTVPSDFPSLFEEALIEEGQRARARVADRARIAAMARARSTAISSTLPAPSEG